MKEKEITINSLNDLPSVAKTVLKNYEGYKTFFFYGNLGSGKTTLIQQLCMELGVKEPVTSPTFAIIQEYTSPKRIVYHMDLYRVKKREELYEIGIREYLDSGCYCFIEWPELLEAETDNYVKVEIAVLENEKRKLKLQVI